MNDHTNLRELWRRQTVADVPDLQLITDKAIQFMRKTRNGLIRSNIMLGLTALINVFIIINIHPQMITTKIGIVLIIVAICSYLWAYNGIIPLLSAIRPDASNIDYLKQLIRLKQKQDFMYRTMLTLYFVLLSAGLFLYMIEYAARMAITGRVLAYGLTFLWIAFNWFFIRPRTIRKRQAPLNDIISRLEQVNKQFTGF